MVFRILTAAFQQRRKMMRQSLKGLKFPLLLFLEFCFLFLAYLMFFIFLYFNPDSFLYLFLICIRVTHFTCFVHSYVCLSVFLSFVLYSFTTHSLLILYTFSTHSLPCTSHTNTFPLSYTHCSLNSFLNTLLILTFLL